MFCCFRGFDVFGCGFALCFDCCRLWVGFICVFVVVGFVVVYFADLLINLLLILLWCVWFDVVCGLLLLLGLFVCFTLRCVVGFYLVYFVVLLFWGCYYLLRWLFVFYGWFLFTIRFVWCFVFLCLLLLRWVLVWFCVLCC